MHCMCKIFMFVFFCYYFSKIYISSLNRWFQILSLFKSMIYCSSTTPPPAPVFLILSLTISNLSLKNPPRHSVLCTPSLLLSSSELFQEFVFNSGLLILVSLFHPPSQCVFILVCVYVCMCVHVCLCVRRVGVYVTHTNTEFSCWLNTHLNANGGIRNPVCS